MCLEGSFFKRKATETLDVKAVRTGEGEAMPPVSEMEVSASHGGSTGGLSRADCLCPVCLEIFLEPVTLPCGHTFCKPCFLETVDKANMCCPLCRKRVSTWARHNGRNKTLVNSELWLRVQAAFPAQCQRRLGGLEVDEEEISFFRPQVCLPGEVRQEYEDQISKLAEEKRAVEEAERRASEEYIQRLLAEEEGRLVEESRRQEQRQLEDDERLAWTLSEELNQSPISESQRNTRLHKKPLAKRKPHAGDIEKFLSPLPRPLSDPETSSSLAANKENVSCPDRKSFTPRPDLCQEHPSMQCVATTSTEGSIHPSTSHTPHTNSSHIHPSTGPSHTSPKRVSVSKRKSSELGPREEEEAFSKRPCPAGSPPGGGEPPWAPEEATLLQELAQREEVLFRQHEEDHRLAQALQKELDQEVALQAVDRRKGSSDQYLLRQKPSRVQSSSGPVAATPPCTNRGRSRSASATKRGASERRLSSPRVRGGGGQGGPRVRGGGEGQGGPSSPAAPLLSLGRASRQASLMDMFPPGH